MRELDVLQTLYSQRNTNQTSLTLKARTPPEKSLMNLPNECNVSEQRRCSQTEIHF